MWNGEYPLLWRSDRLFEHEVDVLAHSAFRIQRTCMLRTGQDPLGHAVASQTRFSSTYLAVPDVTDSKIPVAASTRHGFRVQRSVHHQ